MITNIESDRMVIISDLHLGNPFCPPTNEMIKFLKWAADNEYDICINGDGLEMAQASPQKLLNEIPEIMRLFKDLKKNKSKIYYIVGNHDMSLEYFLEDWGYLSVSPFLNVTSGHSRIRVEHGHLYDPFYVKYPRLYEFCTHFAGNFLKISPQFYRLWIKFERWRAHMRAKKTGIIGEPPEFAQAAYELTRRGFDAVVFGHTHHPGEVTLINDKKYFNPGSWMLTDHYVEISRGRIELKSWT